eukprot:CAMPEP_0117546648 /NCGR_PEP_ID=MMETSP0784-20121206/46713_1 /TAXON_ID=39447 /ORGANISM="" /LENGTH=510 /DNA_ID=CAMNT_0005343521 /DNA_START=123 /DNA_END=1655 /DNA_ORIENTATION=-
MAEVWLSLRVEFAMFTMTVFFALVIRATNGRFPKGNTCKLDCDDYVVVARKPRAASPTQEAAAHPRYRGCAAAAGAADAAQQRREPWSIVAAIMTRMRDYPNQRSAAQCLQLYSELRQMLGIATKPTADALGECNRGCAFEFSSPTCLATAAQRAKYSAGELYTLLVHCAVRAGQCHLVDTLTDDMEAQGIARSFSFYESAMKQLAGQKQYHFALSMYDRLCADGFTPSAVMLSCVINFASEVNENERALSVYDRLCEVSTPSIRASMTVLRVLAKRHDWSRSLALLRAMQQQGVKVDALAINVIMSTGIAAGKLDEVEELLSEVEQLQPPIADRVSYNTLVKGYAQRGDADAARAAVERMKRFGHQPNGISFNTLMDALVRGNRPEETLGVLAKMRECGIKPDKFTCTIFIKGLPLKPVPDYTRAAFDVLQESGESCDKTSLALLYRAVSDSAAQVDRDLFLRTASRMRELGITPTAAETERFRRALAAESGGSGVVALTQRRDAAPAK